MAQAVDRHTLGAWLVKANPAQWDLAGFRAAGETRLTSWAVRPGYRSALMAPGDRILFWVSGPGRDGLVRGLWGAGTVESPAEDWVDEQVRAGRPEHAARFTLGIFQAAERGYFAGVDPALSRLLGREPRSAREVLAAAVTAGRQAPGSARSS